MRTIDQRFYPAVGGIDLEQALNYIDLRDVTVDFIYDRYTGSRLPYVKGNRPILEALSEKITKGINEEIPRIQALADYVANEIKWAGYFHKESGIKLQTDRAWSEEKLIESKCAWCNEQARILCCLTQVAGILSRLVFGSNRAGNAGHVVTEVLTENGWMMIDQSFGYLFMKDHQPVRAVDVFHVPENKMYFGPIYKKLCQDLTEELGLAVMKEDFRMSTLPEPIDGFENIGFHNYFVQ